VPGELLDIFQAFNLDLLPGADVKAEQSQADGRIRFSFGELKGEFEFEFYSRFVQRVMEVGDIEQVLEVCLATEG